MRFPIRRLLILGTCFGIWVGMLVQGHYVLGSLGVMGNAVTIACSCYFLFQMLYRWQGVNWAERSRYAIAILVFFAAAVAYQQSALSERPGLVREVQRLNWIVQNLPTYSSVEFSVEKQGWIRASGLVSSRHDLDNLHAMVEKCSKCDQIYWYVGIKE